MDELIEILKKAKIPYAYHHFAEGESPEPPFICWLTVGSDNFAADGIVYDEINVINIELYTDKKNPEIEKKVEDVLIAHEIFYQKEEIWIDSEKLYEVIYEFEWRI